MSHRADLEGANTWTGESAPRSEDWWWDNLGVLCGMTPNGHFCRFDGWEVTGPKDAPTTTPSMLITTRRNGLDVELWHGFLTAGEWRSC